MKGVGAIDDVVKSDFATFPRDDPAELQRKAKLMVEEDKLRKEMERERKAAEKAEAAAVKKAVATKPVVAQQQAKPAPVQNKDALNRVKVKLYYQHCGARLQSKEPKNLHSLAGDELEDLLRTIEGELQSHGGIEMAAGAFIATTQVVEIFNAQFNPFNLALSGPAASLSQTIATNRKAWDDLLTEFAISNAEWFMVGAGKRLIGFVAQTVATVDSANKTALAELYARQRTVPPKEKEEVEQL